MRHEDTEITDRKRRKPESPLEKLPNKGWPAETREEAVGGECHADDERDCKSVAYL